MGLKAIVTFANFATLHPCQGNGIRLSRFNWLTSNDNFIGSVPSRCKTDLE